MTQNKKAALNRGDIYWVDLEPTKGDEIQKKRPCVVLNQVQSPFNQDIWLVAPFDRLEKHTRF